MFTGLIEEVGTVTAIGHSPAKNGGTFTRIMISAPNIPAALKIGDSVAVSGVCLTAVGTGKQQFSADLAQETLQRTSLGRLQPGSQVNLELPLKAQSGARLGGHVVQGHVDGAGKLLRLEKIENAEDWRLEIAIPPGLSPYVVPQGSITIEGISLTVAKIQGDRVEIAIIPHTYQATNLQSLRTGDEVNIEVDVLAKYAEKMAQHRKQEKLTVGKLIQQGF